MQLVIVINVRYVLHSKIVYRFNLFEDVNLLIPHDLGNPTAQLMH